MATFQICEEVITIMKVKLARKNKEEGQKKHLNKRIYALS